MVKKVYKNSTGRNIVRCSESNGDYIRISTATERLYNNMEVSIGNDIWGSVIDYLDKLENTISAIEDIMYECAGDVTVGKLLDALDAIDAELQPYEKAPKPKINKVNTSKKVKIKYE